MDVRNGCTTYFGVMSTRMGAGVDADATVTKPLGFAATAVVPLVVEIIGIKNAGTEIGVTATLLSKSVAEAAAIGTETLAPFDKPAVVLMPVSAAR